MPRRRVEPPPWIPGSTTGVGGPGEVEIEGIRIELPEQDEIAIRARARLRSHQHQATNRYKAHPYPFLTECVWTLDQASQSVRRFPSYSDPSPSCSCIPGGCENFIHHLANRWLQHKRFLVPKSRRVLVSWTMVALHCWLARFFPGTTIAFVSRKQGLNDSEGAAELVRRVKFIEEHLPVEIEPLPFKYNFARIAYPTIGSEIIGVAQGADQLRQYGLTAIFADEFAFWELAADTYAASLPTLEGGGRFTAVSSANPGFFKMMVFDSM